MPPSKGHKKSRNGCVMCKQRRVKCDETHPVCRNCTAHGEPLPCVYEPVRSGRGIPIGRRPTKSAAVSAVSVQNELVLSSTVSEVDTNTTAVGSSEPTEFEGRGSGVKVVYNRFCPGCGHFHRNGMSYTMQEEFPGGLSGCKLINLTTSELNWNAVTALKDLPPLSNLNTFDRMPMVFREIGFDTSSNLSIFNHFTSNTSYTLTLSRHPDSRHVWSQVIPTLSQAHPFLFHSILAITSAHLGYMYRTTQQLEKAADVQRAEERHYVEAMRRLKMAIVDGIDEVNCHATFAATVVCIIYFVSRRRRPSPFNPLSGPTRRHLDLSWISFVRGTCGALHGLWPTVMRGPVSLLVYEYPSAEASTRVLCANTEGMFERLNRLCVDFNILGVGCAAEMKVIANASAYFAALYNLRMIWVVLEEYCSSSSSSSSSPSSSFDIPNTTTTTNSNFHSDGNLHLPESAHTNSRPNLDIGHSAELCAAIMQYVLRTPANFWDCLERKSPRALIIYAYYVACWGGLSYGSDSVGGPAVNEGLMSGEGSAAERQETKLGRWWTQGRAETDLRGIEEELSELASDDVERGIWKEWMEGAWSVFEGLRGGWWVNTVNEVGVGGETMGLGFGGVVHGQLLVRGF